MRRLIRTFSLLLVLVASLASVRTATAACADSPFAGAWTGHWNNSLGVTGTFKGSISPSGVILIDSFENGVGFNGTIRGHVNNFGQMSGVLLNPPDFSNPFTGTMTINQNGDHILGDWVFVAGDVTGVFELFAQ
jgi:hypothetical protein